MKTLKRFWAYFRDLFGLHKNSAYIKAHLSAANMRSGIFMSAIIVVLEIWLVIRQSGKYVFDQIASGTSAFEAVFKNLWSYFLLMSLGIAMLVYCIQYMNEKKSKKMFVTSIVFASISLLLCFFMPFEFIYGSIAFTSPIYNARGIFKIIFYISIIAFNIAIIFAGIYRYRGGNKEGITSILVISLFALVCLTFGVMISYGDFSSTKEAKQIICFLMMSMYVGCLLIWKPYVSIGILGTIFLGFYIALDQIVKYGGRAVPEGDLINYITFFISLTMICISIYTQRVSEAKKDEELEILATKDVLTDLWSFPYFISLVNKKIENEDIKQGEYIYLFCNINNFKLFNDQRGFNEGNRLLKTCGDYLKDTFTDGLVARQSDDHFVIFAKNSEIEERIKLVNERLEVLDSDSHPGLKAGGYPYRDKKEDPRIGVEKARYAYAMLEKQGYGLFLTYDKKMHDNYRMIQYIVNHIDEAVENGYIKAYYQPVVYSKGRQLCGAEALARWIDPKYGFLSPGQFVPALENAMLIYKLDIGMLRLICKQLRESIDNKEPVIPVSINFSRMDFRVVDIVSIIEETIKEFKIPRDLLHIEITESALMGDKELLKESIGRLHKLGYAVWLDDFGSGYSSFSVLKDFAFDVLKLDMEFLNGFHENEKAKYVIESVIPMANQIGIKTLSEGVETKEEADFLEKIGCGRLQGYLYGKPLPYDELKALIDKGELKLSKEIINHQR